MMVFLSHLPQYLDGLVLTLILMLVSLLIGLVLALLLTAAHHLGNIFLKKPIEWFVFFICGTPLLVQIFIIYYGSGQFDWIRNSSAWIFFRDPMACAIMALSINTACYTSVLFNGAIKSVPKNEIDACNALGMSKWLAFRRIIFPRAFRIAVPAYSNEVIMILKGTSLASSITILELMGVTQLLIADTYQPVTLYIIAGLIYLILNFIIIAIFKRLRKWATLPNF